MVLGVQKSIFIGFSPCRATIILYPVIFHFKMPAQKNMMKKPVIKVPSSRQKNTKMAINCFARIFSVLLEFLFAKKLSDFSGSHIQIHTNKIYVLLKMLYLKPTSRPRRVEKQK